MKSPIFIFSLPRSGSTLLQRILMSHKKITSVAEPWLLLPFLYATKKEGQISEYSNKTSELAVNEFINNLPQKSEGYNKLLNSFVSQVFESCCQNNEVYFLDKTPRYYLIISEIKEIFPDAKFVFLFRNPVHVYSSIIATWGENRFKLSFNYNIDLNKGIKLLSEGYSLLKDNSYAVKYEDLVQNPGKHIEELFRYLELEYDESVLENFFVQDTKGSFGDPTGVKDYKRIDTGSLDKWKKIFSTHYRKKVISNYVKKIKNEDLLIQGYSKENILSEIGEIPVYLSFSVRDRFDIFYSNFVRYSKLNIFIGKSKRKWTKGLYLS